MLRSRAAPLTVEDIRSEGMQQLIDSMRETMRDAPGVGLAAPQVGMSLQLVVIEDRAEYQTGAPADVLAARERGPVPFHVLINPVLMSVGAETAEHFEGCLSVAGYSAIVPRAREVRVECLDARGEPQVIHARGWYARILQHEIDHLLGTLYIDRMHTRSFTTVENQRRNASA